MERRRPSWPPTGSSRSSSPSGGKPSRPEGGQPELLSPEEGQIQGFEHLDKADAFEVDKAVSDASPDDYAGLMVPGGVANEDFLRGDEDTVRFVRSFFEAGKPVGIICHGPWVAVEADEEVVVDAGFVTSRNPDDLPAFCAKVVEEICEGRHDEQALQTADAG